MAWWQSPLPVLPLLLIGAYACGGGDAPSAPGTPQGPPGGVLDVDAAGFASPPDPMDAASPEASVSPDALDLPDVPAPPDAPGVPDAPAPPDAPVDTHTPSLVCRGYATPCSSLSQAACAGAQGCSIDGECTGYASSCYSQFNQYSCLSQQGCYWSTYSDSCSGSAWSCSSFSGSYSCVSQKGCYWEDTCSGVARACELFGTDDCDLQPGCSLESE